MSRGVIGSFVLVAAGAAALLWAALASREEPRAKGPPAAPRPRPAAPAPPTQEKTVMFPGLPTSQAPPSPDPGGDDYGIIRERIRRVEERLLDLDIRRNTLAAANQDLEGQIREKSAEASARMMADWRVRSVETLLGLSASQKQALTELWTKWYKEDAGRPADRASWLTREIDVRSRLTAEQAATLHDSVLTQVRQQWSMMGNTLGSMIGASRDDQSRMQQTLGEVPVPSTMLLPEGYAADWPGMMKSASTALQPLLTADQRAKLDRFIQR